MALRKKYYACGQPRPLYTPNMALAEVLYMSLSYLRRTEWQDLGGRQRCIRCHGLKTGGHKVRCPVRDLKWNIKNQLEMLR